MSRLRWILSILSAPILRERSIPLVRPTRIDWDPSLSPQTIQIRGHTILCGERRQADRIDSAWRWDLGVGKADRNHPEIQGYALDLIDHGFSDRPRFHTPRDLHPLFKGLHGRSGVRNHSDRKFDGGGVAWAMAILFPEQVDRLILIGVSLRMSFIRSKMNPSECWRRSGYSIPPISDHGRSEQKFSQADPPGISRISDSSRRRW
jgi:pimeloyl-ACP methyl ester carboxylesterase